MGMAVQIAGFLLAGVAGTLMGISLSVRYGNPELWWIGVPISVALGVAILVLKRCVIDKGLLR